MATFKIEFDSSLDWMLTIHGDSSEADMKTACKIINFFDKKLTTFESDREEMLKCAKKLNKNATQAIRLTKKATKLVNEASTKIKGNTNAQDDDSDLLPGEKVLKRFDLSDDATEAEE